MRTIISNFDAFLRKMADGASLFAGKRRFRAGWPLLRPPPGESGAPLRMLRMDPAAALA
jgi:hypothetical protein